MNPWTLLALAVALALDAFAVAVASGASLRTVTGRQTFRLAWHFGLFQALMPTIGWAAGRAVAGPLRAVDHWAAFSLLAVVGGRMIWQALSGNKEGAPPSDPTKGGTLVALSIATSLDALAVGLSLAFISVSIWTPALVIGIVAGAFTVAGLHAGALLRRMARTGKLAELLGGVVLIAIGAKILHDHGVF